MENIYVDKKLLKISKAGGKYIKLLTGDSYTGKYLGYEEGYDEKYKKDKIIFRFKNEEGKEQTLSTSSAKAIGRFALVIPGSTVTITRLGESGDTDYSVKILKLAKASSQLPVVEVEEEEEESEEEEEDDEVDESKIPF